MADIASALGIELDLQVPRARDARFQLAFTTADGAAININGDSIVCKVYDAFGGSLKFVSVATITDAPGGLADLPISAAQAIDGKTSGRSNWVYVIERAHGGETLPWWTGRFEIHEA